MKVRIEIDTRTFVRFWLVVIGFIVLAFAIYSAWTALVIVGAAFFLALALNAPVSWIAKHLPGKSRILATAISYIGVVLVLVSVVFLVIPPIAQQTAKLIDSVPQLIDNASVRWDGFNEFVARYNLDEQVDQAVESIKENATSWAASIGKGLIGGISSVLSFLTAMFLTIVLSFLMLVEAPVWSRRIWSVYSDTQKMQYHRTVVRRMYHAVTGYVSGALIVSMIGASVAGLTVLVLSFVFPAVSFDLVLPTVAISFLFSLIPMFGTTVGAIIIGGLLALNNIPAAIIYLVVFVVYQQIENNFISPNVQSKTVDLSALSVLVSVTIGIYLFGLAGGIISIPIAAVIKILIEEYVAQAKRRREMSDSPIIGKLAKKLKFDN